MREDVEALAHDDTDGPIDIVAEQPRFDNALVAEEVDQGDGRQQRRHQDRNQRNTLEEALERDTGAGQRVGVYEGHRDDDQTTDQRHRKTVLNRPKQRRRRKELDVIGQTDERSVTIVKALRHNGVERQQDGDEQIKRNAHQHGAHDPVFAGNLGLQLGACNSSDGGLVHGHPLIPGTGIDTDELFRQRGMEAPPFCDVKIARPIG